MLTHKIRFRPFDPLSQAENPSGLLLPGLSKVMGLLPDPKRPGERRVLEMVLGGSFGGVGPYLKKNKGFRPVL